MIGATSNKSQKMIEYSLAKGVFIDQVVYVIFGCLSVCEYEEYFNRFKEKYPRNLEMKIEERNGIKL